MEKRLDEGLKQAGKYCGREEDVQRISYSLYEQKGWSGTTIGSRTIEAPGETKFDYVFRCKNKR